MGRGREGEVRLSRRKQQRLQPKLDGYGVAQRLRQQASLEKTLLIAMTGYGQEEDRRRTYEAGFHHHLVKPVDIDELEDLLASHGGPAV